MSQQRLMKSEEKVAIESPEILRLKKRKMRFTVSFSMHKVTSCVTATG